LAGREDVPGRHRRRRSEHRCAGDPGSARSAGSVSLWTRRWYGSQSSGSGSSIVT
jgi:hypothetical protein